MFSQFINPFLKALLLISIIAATLLSNAFAQSSNANDNQIHIKISKDVNGKRTEIDTTFTNSDDADAFMKSFNDDDSFDSGSGSGSGSNSFSFKFNDDSLNDKNATMHFDFDFPKWNDEDKAKFDDDLNKLKDELKKNIHSFDMHWDTSSNGNSYNYNFNFKMPDEKEMDELKDKLNDMKFDFDFNMPDVEWHFDEPMPPASAKPNFNYNAHGLNDADKAKFEEQMKKAEEEYKKAMDMLKENNGSLNSNPSDKKVNKKIIIIEKSDSKNDKNKSSKKTKTEIQEGKSPDFKINNLNYFPNPNNGKFDLSFNLPTRGDLNVSITDASGKKIYDETLKEFEGDYNQSFDISSHGKGVYFLNITQGKQWMNKKVVVK
ncbi:MAG: T9SS type A sorting domain-containing protein [Bacteroidia bacterium]